MSGLFGILDIASQAMLVTRTGIRVTGHNIANVNTPGYSRQRQVLEPNPPILHAGGHLGTGVAQQSIERVADALVQQQLVDQHAAYSALETQAEALGAVEQLVADEGPGGVESALSALFDAFSDLASAASPGASAERQAVRGAAQTLVDSLHRVDARLRAQQEAANRTMASVLGEINDLAARVAELNRAIVQQETMAPANDLRDQRDEAVRQLAQRIDVDSFELDNGALVVTVAGGLSLVDENGSHPLVPVADPSNPFDPGFFRVGYDDGANVVDITAEIGGGRLGGLLRVRDTLLPAAIRSLDTLAYNLVDRVNRVHAGGVGLDGSVGDFFVALPQVEDAARDIALAPSILASPDAIAAGFTSAPGDNRNALLLAQLRDQASALFLPGDPPGSPSGPTRTLLEHVAAVIADVGEQARALESARAQQQQVLEVAQNRRDELSGVSLDEEVTRLIRLQAAFQANARVTTTVSRLLEDVVSLL